MAIITLDDVTILPYDANLGRMEFSEGTGFPRKRGLAHDASLAQLSYLVGAHPE
jgi:hypothetical protein